ncbi:SH2 domain protein [Trichuris suis]|nr:SH2 domain protein [Trichuris suis]
MGVHFYDLLNFVLFTVLRIEFSIASRAVQPFIPRDVVQPSEPFCLCMERTKDSNTQRLFSPTEREMRSPTHYAVAEDDHLLQNAFERRLYMADQRDQSSGSVYGSLPSDWSVSSATNAESWLDKQMQKLKLRQELTDPHLKKRREQERLLLEELKQVHEDRVARHNRQESDYTVEGIGSKSGASGDDEHSLYAVVSKISTPMGNDKTFYKMETKPAEVESPDLSPLHVNDARMVLSPVDYPTASLLQNGINNSNRYPRAVELQNVDRSTTKSLSSPKSILKKSKPVGAQLLSSPVVDDTRPEEQGILSGQLNDRSNLSRNYASPSSLCSRPNKVAILLHYTSKRLSLQMRPETPSFPLRRTETPLPYHPLLYSDAAGAEVSQNRIANRVGPGCIHSGSIRSQSPASHYYAHSVRSSLTSLLVSRYAIVGSDGGKQLPPAKLHFIAVNFYVKLHTPPPGVDLNCDVNHSGECYSDLFAKVSTPLTGGRNGWPISQHLRNDSVDTFGLSPIFNVITFSCRGRSVEQLVCCKPIDVPDFATSVVGLSCCSPFGKPIHLAQGSCPLQPCVAIIEPMEVVHHHPVFVKDTSKFWYKPSISREEAISVLKDKQPGAFIIRDSNSFPGAFGLALKVAIPPPGVQTKSNDRSELVRHFLIETTAKGVKLKGCNNEPIFGSLAALVYQHSMTPLALPCKLLLPEYDPALSVEQITTAQQLLDQGAACNVTYLFSNETESLTGPEAVRRTVDVTLTTASTKELDPIVVHLKVSSQGITITDNARKKFFRRHYPVPTITHCSVDPENRQWSVAGSVPAMIFGFVARKSVAKSENVCHVFAELEPEQPASAIVNFISRVILAPSHTVSTD